MNPRPRPTSVTVFGILNIIFGGLGLCGVVMSAGVMASSLAAQGYNPAMQLVEQGGFYKVYMIACIGLGSVATIVLLASGIGLLNLRPWARRAAIGYAWYAILSGVTGLIVNFVYLYGPLLDQLGGLQGPQRFIANVTLASGLAGALLGLLFPVLLLYFMLRPHVVAAFGIAPGVSETGTSRFGPATETGNPYQSPER